MTRLDPANARHHLASDPTAHVWVNASAGTGKTRALTDRILRLLLAGAPPQSLLAITFTRTAAAEMQARVFDALAAWARHDDATLDAALAQLGETPSAALRARARGLLLRVLDAPQGLEIRTIHGLAQSLLAAFPVEAGLPPRADPLDERRAAALRRRALTDAMADSALRPDLERLAVEAGESAIEEKLGDLVRAARGYAEVEKAGGAEAFLRGLVGVPPEPSWQEILENAVVPPAFDDGAAEAFALAMEALNTDAKRAEAARARAWLARDAAGRVEAIEQLFACVRTKAGEPRKLDREIEKVPALAEPVLRLLEATERLIDLLRARAFVAHAGAWLRLGMAVSARYAALKRAEAAIDFDDMVALAADLVHAQGMANAIAERLDRRILHVLVDEAQDTNADQWHLVEGLSSEFDAGEGQHGETVRTRFVVGDFKQAIFRFQGTDPEVFLEVRARWSKKTAEAGRPTRDVPLVRNFRSAPLLLALVDRVLSSLGTRALGLHEGAPLPHHEAARADLPGRVLLFPPHVAAAEGGANGGEEGEEPADPDFAAKVAAAVAAMVRADSPHRLTLTGRDGTARPAGPGDVLILLRKRGDLMGMLVRALHAEGLPVAGVDRARLAEPLAVRDLLSLVRFVLQPADDLALAEVLTSPLGGLDHETLRRLRQPGQTLWQAFAASADPAHAAAQRWLRDALARADFAGPHAFLEAVLAEGGRAALRARLGPEADDGIDALLAEALAFEADRPPTLQGFLAHLAASDEPLKRDPDSSPGLVRLMTVHGAKGLEAPIVVLADALAEGRPRIDAFTRRDAAGRAELPLVFGRADRLPSALAPFVEAEQAAERAERNRLLYVALTRAEQVLLVAGQISRKEAAKRETEPEAFDSWHDRIRRAMEGQGAAWSESSDLGRHLRLEQGQWPSAGAACSPAPPPAPVPAWTRTDPLPEPSPPRPFTPSHPAPDSAPQPPPSDAQRAAAARGVRLHALFERLPGVPPPAREAFALRLLEAMGEEQPAPLVAEALAVLNDPVFAPLFGPDSLAEAPIAGHVDGLTVSGTVDRLLVTPERVLVVDFKTGLAVPARPEEAHPSHLRQMAAYRAVLAAAFPGRRIEAALLYTAGPRIHWLPPELLAAHWPPGEREGEA